MNGVPQNQNDFSQEDYMHVNWAEKLDDLHDRVWSAIFLAAAFIYGVTVFGAFSCVADTLRVVYTYVNSDPSTDVISEVGTALGLLSRAPVCVFAFWLLRFWRDLNVQIISVNAEMLYGMEQLSSIGASFFASERRRAALHRLKLYKATLRAVKLIEGYREGDSVWEG